MDNEMEDDIYKYFTQEEIDEAMKELEDMKKHPEKYKAYHNIEELIKDLESDD